MNAAAEKSKTAINSSLEYKRPARDSDTTAKWQIRKGTWLRT